MHYLVMAKEYLINEDQLVNVLLSNKEINY